MELKTDRAGYESGKPVRLELTVTNTGGAPARHNFSSASSSTSGSHVADARCGGGRGEVFTMALTSITLSPARARPSARRGTSGIPTVARSRRELSGAGRTDDVGPRPAPATREFTIGAQQVAPATVSAVLSKPEDYVGKMIAVSGTYCGWKKPAGVSGCESGPPATRSDWILSDGRRAST